VMGSENEHERDRFKCNVTGIRGYGHTCRKLEQLLVLLWVNKMIYGDLFWDH
jgi:hypothetical protein